ncbi:MAG TPA: Holliday junction resolvase RuvX [Clostridiales bacterium]|nr:Holliday junction resolvase RuvX [Clostridiaceae bacterium]HOQ08270.1 Holliday junction resolvase RuvX [Clostridiales bacterium]HPV02496.1 Holliday junction resolvase RuvX [Clostridiales bacterium]
MRIMGIDFGDSRIGIAVSDPLGWTAQGLETIQRKGTAEQDAERIRQLAVQYGVGKIVIGLPKNMNGTIGPSAQKAIEFGELLARMTGLEVVQWDERLTTVAANRMMHEVGMKTSKKKKSVDRIAAVFILQGYLDSMRN